MKSLNRKNATALIALIAVLALAITAGIQPVFAQSDEHEEQREHFDNEREEVFEHLEMFQRLLGLIQQYASIAESETTAGVAAVMSVEEHAGGRKRAIKALEGMLPNVTNDTIKRAIHLKLVDHYGEMDDQDKAMEHLKQLILNKL